MKKYVKPELFFEQFELSQHIADCALEMIYAKVEECAANPDPDFPHYLDPAVPVFIDSNTNCKEKLNVYCYTPGTNGVNTFTS